MHCTLRLVAVAASLALSLGHKEWETKRGGTFPVETRVLNEFFAATGGTAWKDWQSWRLKDPCLDGWKGVTCETDGSQWDHVVSLDLPHNGLAGTLPTSLSNLRWLRKLNLRENSLSSSLPDNLGDLIRLQWVLHASGRVTILTKLSLFLLQAPRPRQQSVVWRTVIPSRVHAQPDDAGFESELVGWNSAILSAAPPQPDVSASRCQLPSLSSYSVNVRGQIIAG